MCLPVHNPHVAAQEVTNLAPPAQALPNAPAYPDAEPISPADEGAPLKIETDTQSVSGDGIYTFDGKQRPVQLDFHGDTLRADHIVYNEKTGEVTLMGHVTLDGAENDEHIQASHGSFNIQTKTGRFFDVKGSIGLNRKPSGTAPKQTGRAVYANGNPFLFNGRMVVKSGPKDYEIYGGTVTSCQLPHPDWLLSAGEFQTRNGKATARNSIFHLHDIPVFWLPYVTHPTDTTSRQSGILIPEIGINSASKGNTIGEQVYWAINRSSDLTVGTIFYSARGYEEIGSFRYRGPGQSFVHSSFSSLQDRGYTPPGGAYINQSGTDVIFSGRRDFGQDDEDGHPPSEQRRIAGDVEYLSSFPYREAFSPNFNQAVSTDVISTIYATQEWNGMAASLEGDRYQGEKRVASQTLVNGVLQTLSEEQLHIIHAPSLEFTAADHRLGSTGLEWFVDSSITGLKRAQPDFTTSGITGRLDVHPGLAYPMGFGGWWIRPAFATRETFYTRSQSSRTVPDPGFPSSPVESTARLNRSDYEFQLELRPPELERTFDSGLVRKMFGRDVRHVIEPQVTYRYIGGIDNFGHVLRFDPVDVVSDTNELEYGLMQHLYLRPRAGEPCQDPRAAADATELLGSAGQSSDSDAEPGLATGKTDQDSPVCGNREWISWQIGQKYFFNHNFGGAVPNGPRSVLQTTLDFSGISFLTRPRDLSPVISRLRVRTSEKMDLEWDFDFDFCSAQNGPRAGLFPNECDRKFTSNNLYLDVHQQVHQRKVFAGIGYARLNAPGKSYVEGTPSTVAKFDQIRVLAGFGEPTKPGLSVATYAGLDLDLATVQYGAVQTSYNWNCCGLSIEYRKYELGTARNDNGYKFNFTLANIGSAGNLRHADQIF